jgi:hypothetical protein
VLASSLDSATTLRTLSRLIVPTLADWCIIDLVTRDHAVERVAVGRVRSEHAGTPVRAPAIRTRLDVAATRRAGDPRREAILFPEVTDETLASTVRDAAHLALMRRLRPHSALAVPLVSRSRIVGALTLVR